MCPYCGEMINERASVCKYCGRMLRCDCDVHDSGNDGWRPAPSEDRRTGQSAQRARRRNRGKLWGVVIGLILLVMCVIAAISALIFGFVRENINESDFDDFWSDLIEDGDIDAPDEYFSGSTELEAPIANLADRYTGALTTDDHEAMAELFVPEIRTYYENETDEMLTDLDEWFDYYGKAVDRMMPTGQDDLPTEDFSDAEEALGVTFDRAVDAQILLLFEDGEELYVDLVAVETDGSWYLYSTF